MQETPMKNTDDFLTRKEIHVVLYSPKQGSCHVESLTECIESNIVALTRGVSLDWQVVAAGSCLEEAIRISEQVDLIRHQWPGYEIFTGSDMRPLAEIQKEDEG